MYRKNRKQKKTLNSSLCAPCSDKKLSIKTKNLYYKKQSKNLTKTSRGKEYIRLNFKPVQK